MSLPTEIDFAIIELGDGAGPEVFSIICGLTDVTINQSAQTSDRFVRDCTKPGEVPVRKVKASGKMLEITGSGVSNLDQIDELMAALGKNKNYKVKCFADDGTDGGDLLGTYAGAFMLTASNLTVPRDGAATAQVTLANNGPWTFTAAS